MNQVPNALKPHPSVIATPLRDGTAVLLHLETKRYFSLDADGWQVWRRLAAAGTTLAAFPASCQAFWQDLLDHDLVQPQASGTEPADAPASAQPHLTAYPALAGVTFLSGGGVAGPVVI